MKIADFERCKGIKIEENRCQEACGSIKFRIESRKAILKSILEQFKPHLKQF